jgi:hypothetical protein
MLRSEVFKGQSGALIEVGGRVRANLMAATGADGLSCFRDSAGLHRALAGDPQAWRSARSAPAIGTIEALGSERLIKAE